MEDRHFKTTRVPVPKWLRVAYRTKTGAASVVSSPRKVKAAKGATNPPATSAPVTPSKAKPSAQSKKGKAKAGDGAPSKKETKTSKPAPSTPPASTPRRHAGMPVSPDKPIDLDEYEQYTDTKDSVVLFGVKNFTDLPGEYLYFRKGVPINFIARLRDVYNAAKVDFAKKVETAIEKKYAPPQKNTRLDNVKNIIRAAADLMEPLEEETCGPCQQQGRICVRRKDHSCSWCTIYNLWKVCDHHVETKAAAERRRSGQVKAFQRCTVAIELSIGQLTQQARGDPAMVAALAGHTRTVRTSFQELMNHEGVQSTQRDITDRATEAMQHRVFMTGTSQYYRVR